MNTNEKNAYARRLFKKYPDKIPVIIKKDNRSTMTKFDSEKFLVPRELTVSQFIYTLRQRIKLKPDQAIFLFFDQQIVNASNTMLQIYEKHHNKEDELLYATYASESTFGYQ
jgi:hypothetical protein